MLKSVEAGPGSGVGVELGFGVGFGVGFGAGLYLGVEEGLYLGVELGFGVGFGVDFGAGLYLDVAGGLYLGLGAGLDLGLEVRLDLGLGEEEGRPALPCQPAYTGIDRPIIKKAPIANNIILFILFTAVSLCHCGGSPTSPLKKPVCLTLGNPAIHSTSFRTRNFASPDFSEFAFFTGVITIPHLYPFVKFFLRKTNNPPIKVSIITNPAINLGK